MGVQSREPWVQFGPQLEQQHRVESECECRLSPRLVGYFVILGYGLECESLLYFKGEVVLRLVFDSVNIVTARPLALSYWEGEETSTMWVTTRVIRAKSARKE